MLIIFCFLFFSEVNLAGVDPTTETSSFAFKTDIEQRVLDDQLYFFEGFEGFQTLLSPWSGFRPWWWFISETYPNSGSKSLYGRSRTTDEPSWVISPTFQVPDTEDHLVIEAFLKITAEGSTWQFVAQGSDFIMARMIVYPDGQVAVFDADTGDATLDVPFQFELSPASDHVKCTFLLDRFQNRYSLYLNDQKMHTGTPFTTDLAQVVFVCGMEGNLAMIVDDVSVRPLPRNVPTLQGWALIAMVSCMLAAALWQRRRLRLSAGGLITDR